MMAVLAWRDFARQRSVPARAICVALIAWSLLTMGHAAMRLALPPFAFGLAAAIFFGARPGEWNAFARRGAKADSLAGVPALRDG
jgi:hypothetical protein